MVGHGCKILLRSSLNSVSYSSSEPNCNRIDDMQKPRHSTKLIHSRIHCPLINYNQEWIRKNTHGPKGLWQRVLVLCRTHVVVARWRPMVRIGIFYNLLTQKRMNRF